VPGPSEAIYSPFDRQQQVGEVQLTTPAQVQQALDTAVHAFARWNAVPVTERAAALRRLGDLLEQHFAELMALCAREAGKQLSDGIAEIREAVDFCRYYASQAEQKMGAATPMPGPTG